MGLLDLFKPSVPLVMLVDDNQMLLDMYETFLEALSCRCEKVNDSREAVAKAVELKPQMILMDISMPGYTGLQVLEMLKVKAATKDIPVIMVTGENTMGDIETAFKLGAADYVVKPVSCETFLSKVRPQLAKLGYKV